MKVICIKQNYPEDYCGNGPNEYAMILTSTHLNYAAVMQDWESGTSVFSNDYDATGDKVYEYCLNRIQTYFENSKNIIEDDEWEEYVIQVGICDVPVDEFNKLKLVKESTCMEFVEQHVEACYNVSEDEKIRICLEYIKSYFGEIGLSLGEWCEYNELEKEELAVKIEEIIKNS